MRNLNTVPSEPKQPNAWIRSTAAATDVFIVGILLKFLQHRNTYSCIVCKGFKGCVNDCGSQKGPFKRLILLHHIGLDLIMTHCHRESALS